MLGSTDSSIIYGKDLWCYVESTYETQKGEKADQAKITRSKNQARAIILCNVDISIVPLIMKTQNPQEIWAALENVHESKCLAAKQMLRTKLLSLRMTKDQSIRHFASEICLLETELSYAEHETVQQDKKFVLLNGLRTEFSTKRAILQERNISFEDMVSALEVTESEISTSQPPDNNASNAANAFIADRPKKKCTICKRVGHTYYDR